MGRRNAKDVKTLKAATANKATKRKIDLKDAGAYGDAYFYNTEDGQYYQDKDYKKLAHDDTAVLRDVFSYLKDGDVLYVPEGHFQSEELSKSNINFSIIGERPIPNNFGNKNFRWGSYNGSIFKAKSNLENTDFLTIGAAGKVTSVFMKDISLWSPSGVCVVKDIPDNGTPAHRWEYIINKEGVNGIVIPEVLGTTNTVFEGVSVMGFSGTGISTKSLHANWDKVILQHCGLGLYLQGNDNIFHKLYLSKCKNAISTSKPTAWFYNTWIDEIIEHGIQSTVSLSIIFTGVMNHIGYAGIKANLNDCLINARINRCGTYYSGTPAASIPEGDEGKACVIYSEQATKNNISIITQTRPVEDDSTGGTLPVIIFAGKNWSKNSIITSGNDFENGLLWKKTTGGAWDKNTALCNGEIIKLEDAPSHISNNITNISIPSGALTEIQTFNLTRGTWLLTAFAEFATNDTGKSRTIEFYDGTNRINVTRAKPITESSTAVSTTTFITLESDADIKVRCAQDSGAALNLLKGRFAAQKIM